FAHLFVALFHRRFARELDAALIVDADAFDPDFIADFDDVLRLLDAEVGQFANVHQAVLAGEDFHKTAEFLDRHHLAPIDLADLDLGGHALDGFAGNLHPFGGDGINLHRAVVFDVDFAAR